MRYKAEYDEYSETNKFLDELFKEDCEIGWQNTCPTDTNNALNITVVKPEGSVEETYLKTLAEEMAQKICEIIDMASSLPTERDKGLTLTKEELISRMISISNSLDMLKCDIKEFDGIDMYKATAIIGGGCNLNPVF